MYAFELARYWTWSGPKWHMSRSVFAVQTHTQIVFSVSSCAGVFRCLCNTHFFRAWVHSKHPSKILKLALIPLVRECSGIRLGNLYPCAVVSTDLGPTEFTTIYGHRASTARLRASRVTVPSRAVPGRAMGQAIGPRHGTRAKFLCRAAHGARPMYPCRTAHGPAGLIWTIKQQINEQWSYMKIRLQLQLQNNDHQND
jgi:hypothetical protein